MTYEEATWPDDYPKNIITRATNQWNEKSDDERLAVRQQSVDEMQEFSDSINDLFVEEIDNGTRVVDNLHPFDALWAFLALGAAWQVGSGGTED